MKCLYNIASYLKHPTEIKNTMCSLKESVQYLSKYNSWVKNMDKQDLINNKCIQTLPLWYSNGDY